MDDAKLDVIAVGAHPDDVEIGCGGTLAVLAEQGIQVGIVDLTDGEPTPLSSGPEARLEEAAKAAEVLGVAKRVTLDLPNRRLFDCFEARVALAKELRRYRPKLVISLHGKTPMASPDHWQAMQIADAAVFYSRLTKWDEQFDGLPVHTVDRQIYYTLGFEAIWSGVEPNQFVFDIRDKLSTKIKALRCYRSQFPPAKEYLFRRVEHIAGVCGVAAGFESGEAFVSTRVLGSRDIFATLLPAEN